MAGGLYLAGNPPLFVADAVADPLAGLVGAAVAADLLGGARAAAVEVPLARAAAWAGGAEAVAEVEALSGGWAVRIGGELVPVAEPKARPARPVAPPFDAHGGAIRAEFRA